MQEWEYRIEIVAPACGDTDIQQRLNKHGSAGWELAGIQGVRMIFKRPKQESLVAMPSEHETAATHEELDRKYGFKKRELKES